jgi:phenylalanyl-tRNA synthetase beta chain
MKISPTWLREFVTVPVDDRRLADDLTMAGIGVESVSGDGAAAVFETEITTNRVDAMNHYGIAREMSAIYDAELKPLTAKLPAAKGKADFKIEIADGDLCARYTARIIRGVKVGPSPAAMVKRLELLEQRAINNAADATNYNLLEMGHPTHAFDLDLLEGGKIIVRRAKTGEKLKTLDGVERTLTSDDLVIADAGKAVALAGIMGGFDTMITEKTKNVLIESAWFAPAAIRRTSRRLGMHTDASHRFERGADWGATPLACARVAELILASAGGELIGGEIDAVARTIQRPSIDLRQSEVLRILGQDMSDKDMQRVLGRLGFKLTVGRTMVSVPDGARSSGARTAVAEETQAWQVGLPTWRLDVEREIDLIEELARVYGYERFENSLPSYAGSVTELPDAAKDARARATMLALGYHEAISLTFIAQADAEKFASETPVPLENPISEEATVMRTSLVPGMLDMLAWNLNRGVTDARLFEAGTVFAAAGHKVEESKALVIGATGNAVGASVHEKPRPYSFYDLKGDVETLLGAFGHTSLYFDAPAADFYHPGRSARIVLDGQTIGRCGQVHPDVAAARKMRQEVYVAEVQLQRLYRHELRQPRYQAVPRYPAVARDFSFVFDEAITFDRMRTAVEALKIGDLRSFQPVETFRGAGIGAGKYSLLLRATFQSAKRTLHDDEVAQWSAQVIQALEALGGKLRS